MGGCGGAGGSGGKEEGRGSRYQGNTERERQREAAMREGDVIPVMQPIREQCGGKGGREDRQSSEGCVLYTTAASVQKRAKKRHDSVERKEENNNSVTRREKKAKTRKHRQKETTPTKVRRKQ